jgi:TP901 family phage tail tape measure protein
MELEALLVKIIMDAQDFVDKQKQVLESVDILNAKIATIPTAVIAAGIEATRAADITAVGINRSFAAIKPLEIDVVDTLLSYHQAILTPTVAAINAELQSIHRPIIQIDTSLLPEELGRIQAFASSVNTELSGMSGHFRVTVQTADAREEIADFVAAAHRQLASPLVSYIEVSGAANALLQIKQFAIDANSILATIQVPPIVPPVIPPIPSVPPIPPIIPVVDADQIIQAGLEVEHLRALLGPNPPWPVPIVQVNAAQLASAVVEVDQALSTIEMRLINFSGNISAAVVSAPFSSMAKSLEGIGRFLKVAKGMSPADLANITALISPINKFSNAFSKITARDYSSDFGKAALSLSRIGSFTRNTMGLDPNLLDIKANRLSLSVRTLFGSFAGIATPDVEAVGGTLRRIGTFVNSIGRLPAGAIDSLTKPLTNLFTAIGGASSANLDAVTKSLGRLTSFIRSTGTANLGNLNSITAGFVGFFRSFAGIPADAVYSIDVFGKAMGRLTAFMKGTGSVNMSALGAISNGFVSFFKAFSGISPAAIVNIDAATKSLGRLTSFIKVTSAANPAAVVKNMQQMLQFFKQFDGVSATTARTIGTLGRGMAGMAAYMKAAGTAGAGLPPVINKVTNAFSGAQGPAATTGGIFSYLTNKLKGFGSAASSANANFGMMKMGLAAFAGYGVSLFAKFDDALTRVMARMQDWQQSSRLGFEQGLTGISTKSGASKTDLAGALDKLTSSGMNAAMAMKALAIAETFSVASGIPLIEATNDLSTIQRSLGLASTDVETHYKNMTKLSDLLVGSSTLTEASTKQMADAFTGHFLVAMERTKLSLEDSIGLLTLFAARSKDLRGAAGGDAAARFLSDIASKSVENRNMWRLLLGENGVHDAAGNIRPIQSIVEQLEKTLGGAGTAARDAKVSLLAMGGKRTYDAVMTVVGGSAALKAYTDQLKTFGGISQKIADMIRGGFLYQMKILWRMISNVAETIGRTLAPAIAYLTTGLATVITFFERLNPVVQKTVIWMAVLAASFGTIVTVALALLPIGSILSGIATMAGWVVAAIGGISAIGSGAIALFGAIAAGTAIPAALAAIASAFSAAAAAFIPFIAGLAIVIGILEILAVAALATGVAIAGMAYIFRDQLKVIAEWIYAIDWADLVTRGKHALEMTVGFFYNLGDNLEILYKWMGENWADVLKDMLSITGVFITNMLWNFGVLMRTLAGMFYYFASEWLPQNWDSIKADIRTLAGVIAYTLNGAFVGIGVGMMKTFGKVFEYLKTGAVNVGIGIYNELERARVRITPGAVPNIIAPLANPAPTRAGFIKDMQDGIKTGVDSANAEMAKMTKPKWLTDMDTLRAAMNILSEAGIQDLAAPLDGFVSSLKNLPVLNLELPKNFWEQVEEWLRKPVEPHKGSDDSGMVAGKSGPGFQFKQISLERTMLGGEAAERLDYQQLVTMRQLVNRQDSLIGIANGILNKMGGGKDEKSVTSNTTVTEAMFPNMQMRPVLGE